MAARNELQARVAALEDDQAQLKAVVGAKVHTSRLL